MLCAIHLLPLLVVPQTFFCCALNSRSRHTSPSTTKNVKLFGTKEGISEPRSMHVSELFVVFAVFVFVHPFAIVHRTRKKWGKNNGFVRRKLISPLSNLVPPLTPACGCDSVAVLPALERLRLLLDDRSAPHRSLL